LRGYGPAAEGRRRPGRKSPGNSTVTSHATGRTRGGQPSDQVTEVGQAASATRPWTDRSSERHPPRANRGTGHAQGQTTSAHPASQSQTSHPKTHSRGRRR
jgi:hypothetical protein